MMNPNQPDFFDNNPQQLIAHVVHKNYANQLAHSIGIIATAELDGILPIWYHTHYDESDLDLVFDAIPEQVGGNYNLKRILDTPEYPLGNNLSENGFVMEFTERVANEMIQLLCDLTADGVGPLLLLIDELSFPVGETKQRHIQRLQKLIDKVDELGANLVIQSQEDGYNSMIFNRVNWNALPMPTGVRVVKH